MTRSQLAAITSVCALSSLAGGFLAALALRPSPALAQTKGDVVSARQFQVTDDDGKPRALLGMLSDGGVALTLFDAAGEPRFVLASKKDGTKLAVLDGAGKVRLTQAVQETGSVVLSMSDPDGNDRISQVYHKEGTCSLLLSGPDGKEYVSLTGGPSKSSTLLLSGAGGNNAGSAMLSVLGDSRGVLAIMNGDKPRFRAMTQTDGAPSIELINGQNQAFWSKDQDDQGKPDDKK
jgi:hypothetical protein